jgi:hypothetical protein
VFSPVDVYPAEKGDKENIRMEKGTGKEDKKMFLA